MIYLAGDSVFDNASYTSPSLIQQMGQGARLLARDGAVVSSVLSQLSQVRPGDADALVLSVGGNDALRSMDLVTGIRHTAPDALAALSVRVTEFECDYTLLLNGVRTLGFRRLLCCTIYNGRFDVNQAPIRAGVRIFNDAILSAARRASAGVLDLRDIFTSPDDYANPIEPSHVGGAKLVAAIRKQIGG